MNSLQQLAQADPRWSLEEFVHVTNDLLPQFLPQEANARVQDEVNPRLVRYYTTQGLLDKPLKQGREARYTYRHLLQLLVIRRLLAEGYSGGAIDRLVSVKSDSELAALLQGGVQLTVEAANPALAFLQQIQQPSAAPARIEQSDSAVTTSRPLYWIRLKILPGLEIHVREDFIYPGSSQERQNLLQIIAQHLADIATSRKRPP